MGGTLVLISSVPGHCLSFSFHLQLEYYYKIQNRKFKISDGDNQQTSDIITVTDTLLSSYISSSAIRDYLFPEDRIIVDSCHTKPSEGKSLLLRGPEDFTEIYSDMKCDDKKFRGLVSFGTAFKIRAYSYRYEINIYGKDIRSVRSHIIITNSDKRSCRYSYYGWGRI